MDGELAPGRVGDHVREEVVAHLRDDRIVAATPARDEYRLLIASATARTRVGVARPEGFGRALATYEIPIEGRDEWLVAAGLSA